jgi:hypothetical protein
MIIFKQPEVNVKKSVQTIQPADILKRKDDNCFYELESIYVSKSNTAYYNFYGFTIKGIQNLRLYFENTNTQFEVFLNNE